MEEVRHKRPHVVLFLLYDVSSVNQSVETENKLVVARDEREGNGELLLMGIGVLLFFLVDNENILELDSDGG